MNAQELRNLQEAYMEVYDLDEKSVSWDTGKTASGVSPRDAAARRQAQLQSSSNPADKVRASQVGAVRSNMRAAIQQTGTTSPNQLRSAGPIASQRFKNAAIRQRGGSPASVPIKTVPGLKDANRPKVRGAGSIAQGVGSSSGTSRYQVGGGQGYGISGIKLADEYDLYDIILSHLLDEGYAETPEAAEAIMVNMGEEWRGSIVEAEVLAKKGGVEGTGTGANWKAKSWTDTEKSRYSSYKKPTAPAAKSSGDSPKAPGSAPARPQQPQSSSQPSQVPASEKPKVAYGQLISKPGQPKRYADSGTITAKHKFHAYNDSQNRADTIASFYGLDRKDPATKSNLKKWADTNYRQNMAMDTNDPNYDPTKTSYPEFTPRKRTGREAWDKL